MALANPELVIFLHRKESDYLRDWDWMESHPMGGSESSALHLAREFQALGFKVTVTNDIESLKRKCDVFISVRTWQVFAHGIRPGRVNYLHCTDDIDQPSVGALRDEVTAAKVYKTIEGAILISNYQAARWKSALHLPGDKLFLSANGIPASRFQPDPEKLRERPRWAYYGSTPFRGLSLLLERWERIRASAPGAELHVFSSMGIYGVDDPPEFKRMYEFAKTAPGIHYHGAQGQQQIREVTSRCRALAYPCTFPETSCITAMEAMASGCAVVANALGALPETAAGNPLVSPTEGWIDRWEAELVRVLADDAHYETIARRNLEQSRERDWGVIAAQWRDRFASDLEKSPGPSARG